MLWQSEISCSRSKWRWFWYQIIKLCVVNVSFGIEWKTICLRLKRMPKLPEWTSHAFCSNKFLVLGWHLHFHWKNRNKGAKITILLCDFLSCVLTSTTAFQPIHPIDANFCTELPKMWTAKRWELFSVSRFRWTKIFGKMYRSSKQNSNYNFKMAYIP